MQINGNQHQKEADLNQQYITFEFLTKTIILGDYLFNNTIMSK